MADHLREIRVLDAHEVPDVIDVLAESFFDYPVMRFVLDDDDPTVGYDQRLRTLIGFFVMARVLRQEFLLGIGPASGLIGVAIVSRSNGPESPPELAELRGRVWAGLGSDAESRYKAYTDACGPFPEAAHLHLNMLGVRQRAQGQGHGRRLMDAVHRLARESDDLSGVTLTTEDPANVDLYAHLGYTVTGHASVAPGLETWRFFRPDSTRLNGSGDTRG